jgi:hypothetical protein
MRTRIGRIVAVTAALVMSLAGAGAAQAAIDTNISIRWVASNDTFRGQVSSPKAACEMHRSVKLFKKTASGRQLVGTTRSGHLGGWHIEVMHAHGKYLARVPAQTKNGVNCEGATSKVVDVM